MTNVGRAGDCQPVFFATFDKRSSCNKASSIPNRLERRENNIGLAQTLDPEIASLLADLALAGAQPKALSLGDIFALRALTDASLEAMFARLPDTPSVTMTSHAAEVNEGPFN